MKLENAIGWTDATTNAVTGCDKVSPGCKNCYAEAGTRARVLRSQGRETWGAKGERVPVNFEPVFRRLNKLCVCDKCHEAWPHSLLMYEVGGESFCPTCDGFLRRIRLFADSNSDFLDRKWKIETLARYLDAIRLAPNVDVQLLTKRIENFYDRMESVLVSTTGDLQAWVQKWMDVQQAPNHVWLGVSVEDQKRADERRKAFKDVPAAVKFVSYEPSLERVNWEGWDFVNQIIAGGESGKNRRPCEVEWWVSTAEFCEANHIPFYMKQDSGLLPGQQGRIPDELWERKEFPKRGGSWS